MTFQSSSLLSTMKSSLPAWLVRLGKATHPFDMGKGDRGVSVGNYSLRFCFAQAIYQGGLRRLTPDDRSAIALRIWVAVPLEGIRGFRWEVSRPAVEADIVCIDLMRNLMCQSREFLQRGTGRAATWSCPLFPERPSPGRPRLFCRIIQDTLERHEVKRPGYSLSSVRAGVFSGEVTLRDASLVRGVHWPF